MEKLNEGIKFLLNCESYEDIQQKLDDALDIEMRLHKDTTNARKLLKFGAKIDANEKARCSNEYLFCDSTILKTMDKVKILLELGIDADAFDCYGHNLLSNSLIEKNENILETVKMLLDYTDPNGKKINVNVVPRSGEHALMHAALGLNRSVELVKLLIDNGANIFIPLKKIEDVILRDISRYSEILDKEVQEIIKLLMFHNLTDKKFYEESKYKYRNEVRDFINSLDIKEETIENVSEIHDLVILDAVDKIKKILNQSINAKNLVNKYSEKHKCTPVKCINIDHTGCQDETMLKLLIEYGADISVIDFEPMYRNAIERGKLDYLKFLLEHNTHKYISVRRYAQPIEEYNSPANYFNFMKMYKLLVSYGIEKI